MRTLHTYTVDRESWESMNAAGRYNPAWELTYSLPGGELHTVTLGAGSSDALAVFHEAGRVYVVTSNDGLGYVGLQVFEGSEEVAETFMDSGQGDTTDYILELTPIWQAKRLADWTDS